MYKNNFYVLPYCNNFICVKKLYNCQNYNKYLEKNNICHNLYKIENFSEVRLYNFWDDAETDNLKNLFGKLFQKSKKNNINIYSVFGNVKVEKNNNTLRVQFTGESSFKDTSMFDINLGPFPNKNNTITLLYGFFEVILLSNISINNFIVPRKLNIPKKEFCLFSVSNESCKVRNNFFFKLKEYRNILSCGKLYKNYTCPPGRGKEYFNTISKFKFMICFENCTKDYYFTEKCMIAYLGGAIPIYWGCPQTPEFLNMNSILYLPPNFTQNDEEKLIKRIIELDNNDNLYKQIYEQSFFKIINNTIPDVFNIDVLKNNINKLL